MCNFFATTLRIHRFRTRQILKLVKHLILLKLIKLLLLLRQIKLLIQLNLKKLPILLKLKKLPILLKLKLKKLPIRLKLPKLLVVLPKAIRYKKHDFAHSSACCTQEKIYFIKPLFPGIFCEGCQTFQNY